LLTRFGKRVLRPTVKRYAFLIGAMNGVFVSLSFQVTIDQFLNGIGPSGEFIRWGIYAFLPAALAIFLTRHHVLPGLCAICGYDLRASKDRCPECGTLIPATEVKP